MSNKIIKAMLASSLFCSVTTAYAGVQTGAAAFDRSQIEMARQDPQRFTIDPSSIEVTRISQREEADFSYLGSPRKAEDAGSGISLTEIINIAMKIWEIIEKNAPVVNVSSSYATALPKGITSWNQLSEWNRPRTAIYGFSAKNVYGITVINVRYRVTYTYGGKLNGKGRYLTGVTAVPTVVDVAWGYKFSLAAHVEDSTVVNVGTDANPIAAMQFKLAWTVDTVVKSSRGASVYYIQGDGVFEEIASPFEIKGVAVDQTEELAPLLMDTTNIF